MPPPSERPARHTFIDGLRGFAILGVMAVHLANSVTSGPAGQFRTGILREFLEAGSRGVQLFFMLSAFTLFASSKVRFARDPFPAMNFYLRRAFRILPLWWLTIIVYAHLTGRSGWPSYLMYFGFIRYKDVEVFPMGWSIFVEETFYLMLPFVFARIDSLRRALGFAAACCVVAILWDQLAAKFGVPTGNDFIFEFPLNQWFCIAMGIALFFLHENHLFRQLVIESKPNAPIIDIFAALALFCLLRADYMSASLGLAILFVASMSPDTLFGKVTRNRVIGLFGVCCYSIYLFHWLILLKFMDHRDPWFAALGLSHSTPDVRFFITAPFFAAACLAGGLLSWYGFERPCITIGKRVNDLLSDSLARKKPTIPLTEA